MNGGMAETIPIFWQWLGLALAFFGAVGFLMAVQPFTQAIWGRPKIEVDFGVLEVGDWHMLVCRVYNRPIGGGPLSWLRVSRDSAHELCAKVDIFEDGSGSFVGDIPLAGLFRGLSYSVGQHPSRLTLPSSKLPILFAIVGQSLREGIALIWSDTREKEVKPGRLRAQVTITWNEGKRKAIRRFQFESQPKTIRWLPPE